MKGRVEVVELKMGKPVAGWRRLLGRVAVVVNLSVIQVLIVGEGGM